MPRCSLRHLFIFSKPVIQIVLWVFAISTIYYSTYLVWPAVLRNVTNLFPMSLWTIATIYFVFILTFMFYPVGGFLGDVYLGRYQAVQLGLVLTMVSMVIASTWFILLLGTKIEGVGNVRGVKVSTVVLIVISFLFLAVGLSTFSSNILQFGLDQLIEKPNESQGVLVHWLAWGLKLGAMIPTIFIAISACNYGSNQPNAHYVWYTTPIGLIVLLAIFLLVSYCTRQSFKRDRVKYNPYKMIFKVFNFARKNKYPIGPVSAFAYCYDIKPSRLDYAKERYGGPFKTADVEDVKSFKSVFLLLITLGPVFVLDIPTSTFLFHEFSLHISGSFSFGTVNKTCKSLDVGDLSELSAIVIIPIYMWLIYSVLRNRPPKILHRLGFLVFLYILAVVSMLVTDLTGHLMLLTEQDRKIQPKCMFAEEKHNLNLHWAVLIFPGILKNNLGTLVLITGVEFISAQSPHTMKGVLVGTLFAILCLFRCLGLVSLVPFALDGIWKDGYLGQNPPVISCGFGYYLVCITVASVGLIIFIIAVKKYKYRKRDEEPFSQACVEEIFTRRVANNCQVRNRAEYEEIPGSNSDNSCQ